MNISVLQWNIWYEEDIRHIAEFLKAHPADIVCLQELTINMPQQSVADTPAYIAEQLGYHYYCKELPIESTEGETLTLANGIFSRFPITQHRFAWINQPKNTGGYSDEYRAYAEVTLDADGEAIHVGTTHMSYTHRFESAPHKRAETDLLLNELKRHDSHYIFTGDLNALPDSYTIDAIGDVLADAGPPHDQKTWTTKPFSYNGFKANELKWRLDYVFATKDVEIISTEVLRTDYSDHLPILAHVRIM